MIIHKFSRVRSMRASCFVFVCLLFVCVRANAVDKAVKPQDMHHTMWGVDDGLPGAVQEIVQTKDGYLWVRTSAGPYRFDGLRFESLAAVCQCERNDAADTWIHSGANGGLWIGALTGVSYLSGGTVASYKVSERCGLTSRMVEDLDHRAWVIGQFGLCELNERHSFDPARTPGRPDVGPADIFVDSKGTLWIKGADLSLYFRLRGEPVFRKSLSGSAEQGGLLSGIPVSMAQTPDGLLWDSGYYGLRRIYEGSDDRGRHPSTFFGAILNTMKYDRFKPISLLGTHELTGAILADREGALWLSVKDGLVKIASTAALRSGVQARALKDTSVYTLGDGLSSDVVRCLLEDREGNIWIGTNSGLDRLSPQTFHKAPFAMNRQTQFAIGLNQQGDVLAGNWDTPLAVLDRNGINSIPNSGDGQIEVIHVSPDKVVWVAHGSDLWKGSNGKFQVIQKPQKWFDTRVVAIADAEDGAVWVSFLRHGIYRLYNDAWTDENAIFGIPEAVTATAFENDSSGTLWLAGGMTLYEYRKGQLHKHTMYDKPVGNYFMQRYGAHIWLGGLYQLAVVEDGKLHVIKGRNGELFQQTSGIVETPLGDIWFNGNKGAGLIRAAEVRRAIADTKYEVAYQTFNSSDGYVGYGDLSVSPNALLSVDGRIWMATNKGVFSVDPARYMKLAEGPAPAVAIQSLKAASQLHLPVPGLRLKPHASDVEIQYTALTLSLPERTQFRYRLSEVDREWQTVGTRRQAYYNNLAPGKYRFSVVGMNPNGEWSRDSAELTFEVLPAFYQTWWFRTLLIACSSVTIWLFFRLQMLRSNARVRGRLAERLQERERIARDLHDTLLQGFHGLMLRFHAASAMLATPELAGSALGDALDKADSLMVESRDKIRDLRYESEEIVPLPEALAAAGTMMAQDYLPKFEATVDGVLRDLNPLIKEEVYLVGREALFNAFRHSGGTTVEMEITFHPAWLRLRVRDDGIGIPPDTLRAGGSTGHWGLSGMHERSQNIGGHFKVWNRAGSGCEVELVVSGAIAYRRSYRRNPLEALWNRASSPRVDKSGATNEAGL